MNTIPDKVTFVQLIQENKRIIYKICNSYCTNQHDKEDLAQEIVFQLWKSFHRFNPDFKFSTWLYRVALNVAISFYRKGNKSKGFIPFSENLIIFEEPIPTPGDGEDNIKLLQQFIHELKMIDKSIILLYLDDKSYKEIAEIVGITESNVAIRINRAKAKLKIKFSNLQNRQHGT